MTKDTIAAKTETFFIFSSFASEKPYYILLLYVGSDLTIKPARKNPDPGHIRRDTENLGEASADHIGHYLDNPESFHSHGEIESSLEHKGNRPTERESL